MVQGTNGQSGFQSLVNQRATMQWSHLNTLLSHGRNREAAAIVESFELQLSKEQTEDQYGIN